MKHKEKAKMDAKQVFSIFVIFLMCMIPVEMAYSLSMSNVVVQEVSDRYAIISWITDKTSDSKVAYGLNQTLLDLVKSSTVLTKNHSVMLSPLTASTTYYYNASSVNASESSTVSGSFTTTATDTKAPFIETEVPDFVSSTTIQMKVKTEPNSQVYVYVNSTLQGFAVSNNDGVVNFVAIRLISSSAKTTTNVLRISSIDPAGNRNEITKNVVLDLSPPAITYNPAIPSGIKSRQLTIKGDSDEPATIEFYLDVKSPANRVAVVNASSPWTALIDFPSDKKYALLVYATDRAGNVYSANFPVLVDTVAPKFDTTLDGYPNGHNLAELDPSLVEIVKVKGKVNKPFANVVVLVNDKSGSEATRLNLDKGEAVNIPTSISEAINRATGPKSFTAVTDENGLFAVEIQLTKEFTLTSEEGKSAGFTEGDTWKNEVEIVVVDQVGNVLRTGKKTIRLNRCGGPGYFTISAPTPSPTSIPKPLLKAGSASFGLDFDVKWNGPTSKQDVEIISASITKQQLSQEEIRTKYNLTIGQNGVFTKGSVKLFPDRSIDLETDKAYAFVELGKTEYDFQEGAVFKPELVFPLKFEIQYTYKLPNGKRSDRQTQVKCIPVAIDVDLEMEDYMNEAGVNQFLDKTINTLDDMIKGIDSILKQTRPLQTYAIYGCIGTIVASFVTNLFVTAVPCIKGNLKQDLISGEINVIYEGGSWVCRDTGSTTNDLSCCEATLHYMSLRKYSDWVCDRIFCPSVPTFEKHVTSYSDEIVASSGISGVYQRARTKGEVSEPKLGNAASKCKKTGNAEPGADSECEAEFERAWDSILVINWPWSEYKLAWNIQEGAKSKLKEERQLDGAITDFKSAICSGEPDRATRIFDYGQSMNGQRIVYYVYYDEETKTDGTTETALKVGRAYLTIYETRTVGSAKGGVGYIDPTQGGTITTVGNTAEANKEYLDPIQGWKELKFDRESGCCLDKTCAEAVTRTENPSFSKEKCSHKLPQEVLSYVRSGYDKNYAFNPTSGIINSVRGMCLPAINGYLISYKNLLTAVRNCFAALRAGERLNAGSCQQLLSEVVCDFVIDAISCAFSKFGNFAARGGTEAGGGIFGVNPFQAVVNAGNTISNHITSRYGDTQAFKSLFDEKKLAHSLCIGAFTGDWDVEVLNEMFTEATDIPVDPVCVATPAQRRFVTANPIDGKATYVYTYGGMLSAGSNLQSFSVKLVCSVTNDCSRYGQSSNPNGACDCSGRSKEEFVQVASDADTPISVKDGNGGVVYDSPPKYYTVEGGEYRFDKLVIEYTYKKNNGEIKTDKCSANLIERGNLPSTCKFGPAGFRCEIKLGDRGTARFLQWPSTPSANTAGSREQPFVVGESVNFPARIEVLSPKTGNVNKYLRYVIRNHYGNTVYDNYFVLDEGINDWTGKPIYIIERNKFGSTVTANVATTQIYGGGITKATVTRGAGTSDFIVIFDAQKKASCYYATGSKISSQIDVSGVFPSVSCAGVDLSLEGNPVAYTGSLIQGTTTVNQITSSGASVIFVKAASGSTTVSDECDSTLREWTAKASIYHSELNNNNKWSPNVVIADGKPQQTEEFKFYVACNRGGTTAQSPKASQITVQGGASASTTDAKTTDTTQVASAPPTSTPTPTIFQPPSAQPLQGPTG